MQSPDNKAYSEAHEWEVADVETSRLSSELDHARLRVMFVYPPLRDRYPRFRALRNARSLLPFRPDPLAEITRLEKSTVTSENSATSEREAVIACFYRRHPRKEDAVNVKRDLATSPRQKA